MKTIILFIVFLLSLLFVSFELNSNDVSLNSLSFWSIILIADVLLLYNNTTDKAKQ